MVSRNNGFDCYRIQAIAGNIGSWPSAMCFPPIGVVNRASVNSCEAKAGRERVEDANMMCWLL